jgi:hypothetical protein
MKNLLNKTTIIVAIVSLLVGRYVLTPKQKTKEVIKIVTVEKQHIDTKKKIVTREVKKKDGTIVKETVETENTVVDTEKKSNSESSKTTTTGSNITLGVLAIVNTHDALRSSGFPKPEYGVTLVVPVLVNINAQGLVTTDKRLGVGLSLSF